MSVSVLCLPFDCVLFLSRKSSRLTIYVYIDIPLRHSAQPVRIHPPLGQLLAKQSVVAPPAAAAGVAATLAY